MQFGNKNNDMQLIAQVLSNRRQPVQVGNIALPHIQANNGGSASWGGMLDSAGGLLGGLVADKLGGNFDFEAMKNKYGNEYTTEDMAKNTFGGFPSINHGLPTQNNYQTPDWLKQEVPQNDLSMGYGLKLNSVPTFTGFGG